MRRRRARNPKKIPHPVGLEDVGKEVAAANRLFQPASGECLATPSAMKILLDRLAKYTEKTREQAQKNGLETFYTTQQWANDMAAWQSRLGRYFAELEKVPKEKWDTEEGCHAIYKTVVGPLLDGIWYTTDAPGVVLNAEEKVRILGGVEHPTTDVTTPAHPAGHSNPKPPDVASPFMLSNGVKVWDQMVEAEWRAFWKDIGKNAAELFHNVFGWAGELLGNIARVVGEAIGAGIMAFAKGLVTGLTGPGKKGGGGWGWFAFGAIATLATAGGLYYYAKKGGIGRSSGGGGGSSRRESYREWEAPKDEAA